MFERLDAAWRLYWSRLHLVILIVWTIWLPGNLIFNYITVERWGGESERMALLLGLGFVLVLDTFVAAALYRLFGSAVAGRPCGFRRALAGGFRSWWLLATTRVVVQVLASLGLLLFIVPGLILLSRWALAEAAAVFERAVPSEARRRSVELGAGRRLELLLAWNLPLFAMAGLAWYGETLLAPWLEGAWLYRALYDSLWSPLEAYVVAVLVVYYAWLSRPPLRPAAANREAA